MPSTKPKPRRGSSAPIAVLSLALTPDERSTLKVIAARERVTMLSIVRDLLSEKFPEFKEVSERPRAGQT